MPKGISSHREIAIEEKIHDIRDRERAIVRETCLGCRLLTGFMKDEYIGTDRAGWFRFSAMLTLWTRWMLKKIGR